jgi:hypothetical protein
LSWKTKSDGCGGWEEKMESIIRRVGETKKTTARKMGTTERTVKENKDKRENDLA